MKNERPNAQRNLLKREQSKPEHKASKRYIEVGMSDLHRTQADYIPVNRGSRYAPPQRIPQGSGEVLERDRGSKSPVSLQPPPRGGNKIYTYDKVFRIGEASTKPISPTQLPYRQEKSKNPEKTCKKGLTSGEECGILSELQESGTARSAKGGRTKKT